MYFSETHERRLFRRTFLDKFPEKNLVVVPKELLKAILKEPVEKIPIENFENFINKPNWNGKMKELLPEETCAGNTR